MRSYNVSFAPAAAALISQPTDAHWEHTLWPTLCFRPFTLACKSLGPQIHSRPLPNVESQFPPNCAFLSNCVCFFLSQHILNEFPPGLRAHLHAFCELFQCSGAGSHRFCCLHTKYSPVTLLWDQEKSLIGAFTCLVALGLRSNQGKSDSLLT